MPQWFILISPDNLENLRVNNWVIYLPQFITLITVQALVHKFPGTSQLYYDSNKLNTYLQPAASGVQKILAQYFSLLFEKISDFCFVRKETDNGAR